MTPPSPLRNARTIDFKERKNSCHANRLTGEGWGVPIRYAIGVMDIQGQATTLLSSFYFLPPGTSFRRFQLCCYTQILRRNLWDSKNISTYAKQQRKGEWWLRKVFQPSPLLSKEYRKIWLYFLFSTHSYCPHFWKFIPGCKGIQWGFNTFSTLLVPGEVNLYESVKKAA